MPRPSKSARVTRRSALPTAISSLLGLTFASGLALAQSASEIEFKQCVGNLQAKAVEQGISKQVVDDVLGQVRYQEKVIELDSKQPEFTQTFADYFGRRVTEDRVEKGREMLKEHRDILKRVERETGVPAHYLVAFWGLETNFGSYFGNMPIPASLTTLACDPRRSAYFTEELFAALKIIDAGDVQADNMQGSWAGAMGHVQFMPSVFLRHAVDADGDGRRDLWGSVPDAMASAGNFLKALGWVPGLRWGREVQLPDVFSYSLAGRDESYPVSEWKEFGVKDAFGRPLPNADVEASLLVPSGHRGPAFLVYQNFEIIMRWNRSEFYALAVGRLADRIAGAGPLQTPLPENELQLTRDKVRSMQSYLNMLGFEAGEADGVMGPATRKALSRFQRAEDMVADGYPTQEVLDAMDFDQIQRVQQDQQERAQRKQAKD
ncbi:lytic murein transglycosylase [Hydrocarboniclastica marina]|uniref:lytic murein transglycosylase n=1 Tax=Hydrocarboniclastica marina TaxID=2259620 RepID=UPI001FE4466B|nr:lytic murein transglycosylase [Hydrocarboniclastica marina]